MFGILKIKIKMKRIIFLKILVGLITNITYAQLSTNELPISFAYYDINYSGKIYEQDKLDLDKIYDEDLQDEKDGLPPRFGYKHRVNYTLDNSGEWITLDNGDRLWRLEIYCPDALSINLLYDKFWLPDNAKMFVYSADKKQTIGAFTSANNKGTKEELRGFATGLIYSDRIFIEYYVPQSVNDTGIISLAFVVHGYRYMSIPSDFSEDFGTSESCEVNINCQEGMSWQNEKRAIALIIIEGNRRCTGALINTTANDNRPYLLTADHCIGESHSPEAFPDLDDYTFIWNYESPSCDSPEIMPTDYYTTSGATLLATQDRFSSSDFALLRLNEDPKELSNYQPFYLGWDRGLYSSTVGAVCIHHPKGDVKKISTSNTNIVVDNNFKYWRAYWAQTENGFGITEGGSSGAPLLNANRYIVGQLLGVDIQTNNPCNYADYYSIFGKLNVSWLGVGTVSNYHKLQPWLDPNNTGATTLDGIGNVSCQNGNTLLTNHLENDLTISTPYFATGLVYINSGVTLTLTSTLRMAPGSRIIVRPGAKLIVNGGEIIGACGEYWDGIRVEGNKNLPQTETNQGVVELNNALISDAKDAISVIGENSDWNKTGGIIKATNTTFKNNRRSIEFMSYGEGSNVNNVSYFRNCTFTWDDDLLANESTVQSHITMYQVKGVDFKGCTFKDERTSTTGLTTHGILTNQAGYIVNNYLLLPGHGGTAVYKNTSFENLTYGIRTEEADDKLCKVENSVFDENDKGIYVTNTDNLYVVNNTFNVKSISHGMGLVAQNSTNFTIQKNDFLGTSNTNNFLATSGLQIVSSGADNNLIKQNRFVNLYSGFQALGVNYGINTGLELNCNSFASCQRGIDIPAFPLNNVTGIKSVQGSQSLSAGNKFINNTNNVINNGVNTITYYYYGSIENPNYTSMKFLPIQASAGASCGLIGNMTGPNFPLLSNGDGEENEEEESIETSSIAPTTVLSYINKKDYLSAENLLSTSDMSQEEKNDYRLYSSYIQEYGNSYNIPIDILLDLSGKENNIGLVAKQMLYFKGVKTDLHPKVIVEQTQDSDTTAIINKMKQQNDYSNLATDNEYSLSPNPANSEVVVKGAKEIREITIIDLQGKELKSFYNTEKFNISFLKNGTYIVRILDSGNKVHYQKLIKQ